MSPPGLIFYAMMTVMIIVELIELVVLGLCLGSFVNALVWRLKKQAEAVKRPASKQLSSQELSIVKGRSMCSHCHHPLAAKDLIPVISWLSLRGKCRYCYKPIPDTPLAELLTPTLFIISYFAWPHDFHGLQLAEFALWLLLLTGFVALALYDLKWYLLPDRIVFPLVGIAAVYAVISIVASAQKPGWVTLLQYAGALAISSGIFFVLYQLSDGRWIGGGDVKLGLIIGLVVGTISGALMTLFFASLLGTLVVIPGLLTKKLNRASKLPFGPFLIAATVVVVLTGTRLLHSYTHFLGY